MHYELFIALRYLRARRHHTALSIITVITLTGITLGVAALIYALALSNGFRAEVQDKILQGTAHLNLLKADGGEIENYDQLTRQLSQLPGVTAAAATTYAAALLSLGARQEQAIIKGVDLSAPTSANELFRIMATGDPQRLALPQVAPLTSPQANQPANQLPGIILGKELAKLMGVSVGNTVTLLTAATRLTPVGLATRPRSTEAQVVGIFASGLYEYDSKWAYVALPLLQQISGQGTTAGTIQMQVNDIYQVERIALNVRQALGDEYQTQSWQELNRPLFSALQLQQRVVIAFFTLLILVAALNIITSLTMMVLEKQADIAILRAQGATANAIGRIFILQGALLGLAGSLCGWVLAQIAIRLTNHYQLIALPNEIYSISHLTLRQSMRENFLIIGGAILISFLATLYPARNAAKSLPAAALRFR